MIILKYMPIIYLMMIINQIKVIFIDWINFRDGKQKVLPFP